MPGVYTVNKRCHGKLTSGPNTGSVQLQLKVVHLSRHGVVVASLW
nr:MAG TPA: hypothetical protein [Bacteriophage sp.]